MYFNAAFHTPVGGAVRWAVKSEPGPPLPLGGCDIKVAPPDRATMLMRASWFCPTASSGAYAQARRVPTPTGSGEPVLASPLETGRIQGFMSVSGHGAAASAGAADRPRVRRPCRRRTRAGRRWHRARRAAASSRSVPRAHPRAPARVEWRAASSSFEANVSRMHALFCPGAGAGAGPMVRPSPSACRLDGGARAAILVFVVLVPGPGLHVTACRTSPAAAGCAFDANHHDFCRPTRLSPAAAGELVGRERPQACRAVARSAPERLGLRGRASTRAQRRRPDGLSCSTTWYDAAQAGGAVGDGRETCFAGGFALAPSPSSRGLGGEAALRFGAAPCNMRSGRESTLPRRAGARAPARRRRVVIIILLVGLGRGQFLGFGFELCARRRRVGTAAQRLDALARCPNLPHHHPAGAKLHLNKLVRWLPSSVGDAPRRARRQAGSRVPTDCPAVADVLRTTSRPTKAYPRRSRRAAPTSAHLPERAALCCGGASRAPRSVADVAVELAAAHERALASGATLSGQRRQLTLVLPHATRAPGEIWSKNQMERTEVKKRARNNAVLVGAARSQPPARCPRTARQPTHPSRSQKTRARIAQTLARRRRAQPAPTCNQASRTPWPSSTPSSAMMKAAWTWAWATLIKAGAAAA